jgi:hypothetical protein
MLNWKRTRLRPARIRGKVPGATRPHLSRPRPSRAVLNDRLNINRETSSVQRHSRCSYSLEDRWEIVGESLPFFRCASIHDISQGSAHASSASGSPRALLCYFLLFVVMTELMETSRDSSETGWTHPYLQSDPSLGPGERQRHRHRCPIT